jgi:putative Mg2+ transporter-C (MgtC) family protein
VATTIAYLIVTLGFAPLTRRLPRSAFAISVLRVSYPDGRGVLRQVLKMVTERGFAVDELSTQSPGGDGTHGDGGEGQRQVEVVLQLHGRGSVNELAVQLSEIAGVLSVTSDDVNVPTD